MLSALRSWSISNQDWSPVATIHQGTFFEDVGHLADEPVAQQILEGAYEYPQTLIQQHGSYLRKPLQHLLPCLLLRLPPMSLWKTSRNFGSMYASAQHLPIVVPISATTLPPPFAQTCLFCMQLNFQYAPRMEPPLPAGDKALQSSWKRFLVMCLCTSYVQSAFWKKISIGVIN